MCWLFALCSFLALQNGLWFGMNQLKLCVCASWNARQNPNSFASSHFAPWSPICGLGQAMQLASACFPLQCLLKIQNRQQWHVPLHRPFLAWFAGLHLYVYWDRKEKINWTQCIIGEIDQIEVRIEAEMRQRQNDALRNLSSSFEDSNNGCELLGTLDLHFVDYETAQQI